MSDFSKSARAEVKRIEAEIEAMRAQVEKEVSDDWHRTVVEVLGWARRCAWEATGIAVIAAVILVWLILR